jgi:D-tyrosyl-tRNA(Tyr) deacylase
VEQNDGSAEAEYMAEKIANLRIFPGAGHSMNRSLLDTGGGVLSVSQFTLASRLKKGRRPSFSRAMPPEEAEKLYHRFNELLSGLGITVETGEFGAMMEVDYINDGPVTFILEKQYT